MLPLLEEISHSFPFHAVKGPGDASSEESLHENDRGNICGDVDRAEQSKLHLKAPWEPLRRAQEKVFAPLLRPIIQVTLL